MNDPRIEIPTHTTHLPDIFNPWQLSGTSDLGLVVTLIILLVVRDWGNRK